jgi:hypothetical protein
VGSIGYPHHGSAGEGIDLLQIVRADKVIISAHEGNRYGHPRWSVLHRLARFGDLPDYRKMDRQAPASSRGSLRKETWRHELAQPDQSGHGPRKSFFYGDILITGERGDLLIAEHEAVGSRKLSPQERFHLEMIWNELRYVDTKELEQYRNWPEVKAHLGVSVYLIYDKIDFCLNRLQTKELRIVLYCLNGQEPLRLSRSTRGFTADETLPLWMLDLARALKHVTGKYPHDEKSLLLLLDRYCDPRDLDSLLAKGATRQRWSELFASLQNQRAAVIRAELARSMEQIDMAAKNYHERERKVAECREKVKWQEIQFKSRAADHSYRQNDTEKTIQESLLNLMRRECDRIQIFPGLPATIVPTMVHPHSARYPADGDFIRRSHAPESLFPTLASEPVFPFLRHSTRVLPAWERLVPEVEESLPFMEILERLLIP